MNINFRTCSIIWQDQLGFFHLGWGICETNGDIYVSKCSFELAGFCRWKNPFSSVKQDFLSKIVYFFAEMQNLELTFFDCLSYSAFLGPLWTKEQNCQPHGYKLKKGSPKQCGNDLIFLQRERGPEAKAMNEIPVPWMKRLCVTLCTQLV